MKAEDLTYLLAKLRLTPSSPLALWFIDRPSEYYELLKERDTLYEYSTTLMS